MTCLSDLHHLSLILYMLVSNRYLILEHTIIYVISGYLGRHTHHSGYIVGSGGLVSSLTRLHLLRDLSEYINLPIDICSEREIVSPFSHRIIPGISGVQPHRRIVGCLRLTYCQASHFSTVGGLKYIKIIVDAN